VYTKTEGVEEGDILYELEDNELIPYRINAEVQKVK
jgi:hypothetical protein